MACFSVGWSPQPIAASFLTKADDFGFPAYQKRPGRVGLLTSGYVDGGTTLAISTRYDQSYLQAAVGGSSRSLSMDQNERWKMFRLNPHNTGGRSGTVLQLFVQYTGAPAIDIEQIQFELNLLARRPRFR